MTKKKTSIVERVIEAKMAQLEKLSFSSTMFIQSGPLRKPQERDYVWSVKRGPMLFKIIADPEVGLPYGVYYRLIQIWIDTQILKGKLERTDNGYKLILGNSLSCWLKDLGLDTGGKTMSAVVDQWERFTSSIYTFATARDAHKYGIDGVGKIRFPITLRAVFWWGVHSRKVAVEKTKDPLFFDSFVILNSDYVHFVKKHCVPLDDRILSVVKEAPLGIDFYRFITYRAASSKRFVIKVNDLLEEFGIRSNHKQMKRKLELYLERIKIIWDVQAYFTKGKRGKPAVFILEKSIPSVPPKISTDSI